MKNFEMFPSPYGEVGFDHKDKIKEGIGNYEISVPLRGSWF